MSACLNVGVFEGLIFRIFECVSVQMFECLAVEWFLFGCWKVSVMVLFMMLDECAWILTDACRAVILLTSWYDHWGDTALVENVHHDLRYHSQFSNNKLPRLSRMRVATMASEFERRSEKRVEVSEFDLDAGDNVQQLPDKLYLSKFFEPLKNTLGRAFSRIMLPHKHYKSVDPANMSRSESALHWLLQYEDENLANQEPFEHQLLTGYVCLL